MRRANALRRALPMLFTVLLVSVVTSAVAGAQASATAILDRIRVSGQRPIDFHAVALPETVYVGQQATYQVAVLLSADARSRLRRNPEFLPPELRGLLAYELGTPTRIPPRNFDGAVYESHIFQRALFPVAAGAQVVPAPQLSYTLPQSSSYFSREERYVVRAESASFVVKALPVEGRPDDFNGAVGVLKSSVRIDTTSARVGDPLVLTLRVQGTGNVKLLPRPAVEIGWASAVPGSERVQVDSTGPLVRGTKEFDWILTPARDGRVSVPPLRYSYFDPYAGHYAVAESAPLELTVRAGTLAVADESDAGVVLPLRAGGGTRSLSRWSGLTLPPSSWWFALVLVLLAPLPTWWWSRRRVNPASRATASPSAVLAPDATRTRTMSASREVASTARRQLLDAIARRFGQSPQALVSRKMVGRVLRRGGVTRQTTRDVLALLERLDALGFAEEDAVDATNRSSVAARDVAALLQRVDVEAMPMQKASRAGALIVLIAFHALYAIGAPTSVRAQGEIRTASVASELAAARDAYERRAYAEADQRYEQLAVRRPRDPEILANWGTSAWAAGDTVNAVVAWQRAARLEPLATDLQERIGLLPSGARGGVADVPMIPIALLTSLALGAWLLWWSVLAWQARAARSSNAASPTRVARWARGAALLMLLGSVTAAAGAWWGLRILDDTALAVVARPETMRVAPGTDADAMGGVTTGDVVRVLEARDTWQRVLHADGRTGWLPLTRLIAIQAPDR